MNDISSDVIEMLERKKDELTRMLKQIDVALNALRSVNNEKPGRKIPWSAKLNEVLQSSEKPLSIKEICQILAEKGLNEAKDQKYYNTLFATLQRKIKQGLVGKTGDKRYYWKAKDEKK